MGNAIKYLKHEITHGVVPGTPEEDAKAVLSDRIDKFIQERITLAQVMISEYAQPKITDGDVILVHAGSELLYFVLKSALEAGKKFSVTVIDSRPKLKGQGFLARLTNLGIPCTYALINSISYAMREVSKVFLSAHALLANG